MNKKKKANVPIILQLESSSLLFPSNMAPQPSLFSRHPEASACTYAVVFTTEVFTVNKGKCNE